MDTENQRRRDVQSVSPGTPQISEDDSDEGPLQAIISEETERQSARGPERIERGDQSEVQKGEDDGALGLTRTGQDG
jgi:hypothetical protein